MNVVFIENKTIYLTYFKNVPAFVFYNWNINNPSYAIEFSKNNDCISFLEQHMNHELVNIFNNLDRGAWKADLWRICKLYLNGGVYSDVDINPEPYYRISDDNDDYDINFRLDKSIPKKATFISVLGAEHNSIFQALLIEKHSGKNNFILGIILNFLQEYYNNNNKSFNWPTNNMYNFIMYNVNEELRPFHNYTLNKIKVNIHIGNSTSNKKSINLGWFPDKTKYTITLKNANINDYNLSIKNNHLQIEKKIDDNKEGWNINIESDLYIDLHKPEILYFYREGHIYYSKKNSWTNIGIINKHNKYLLKSRYESYPF